MNKKTPSAWVGKVLYLQLLREADVAKLVDAPDLGSGAVRRGGSIPFIRTKKARPRGRAFFVFA